MRTARIFKNGQSQAVRLRKEYRFDDDEVYISRRPRNGRGDTKEFRRIPKLKVAAWT
jgi:hypothetical protein